jgi:hypothetical protein
MSNLDEIDPGHVTEQQDGTGPDLRRRKHLYDICGMKVPPAFYCQFLGGFALPIGDIANGHITCLDVTFNAIHDDSARELSEDSVSSRCVIEAETYKSLPVAISSAAAHLCRRISMKA